MYLADFGIALDWNTLTRSTTTEDTGKSWVYCAPEVANNQKRNSSSDIWSLGCVFFEMCTVLKGHDIQTMRRHFKNSHDTHNFYQCFQSIRTWSEELHKLGLETDNIVLDLAEGMMQYKAESRPSVDELCRKVMRSKTDGGTKRFCGQCCGSSGDSESTNGSVSDADAWAESPECAITSPAASLPTSPVTTDRSVQSMGSQAEPGADHASVHDRSMSSSSTRNSTAVPKVNVEPKRPADTSLEMSMETQIKAQGAIIQKCMAVPVEANLEVIEDVSPQEPGVVVAKPDFWEPIDDDHLQAPVESSTRAANRPSSNPHLSKAGSSTNDENTEEFRNDYEARVVAPPELPVDSVLPKLETRSVKISPSERKTILPYPSFSKAHGKMVAELSDLDIDDPLGHVSPDIYRGQGVWDGGAFGQEDPDQSGTIPWLPIRPPPVPPKIEIEHGERADAEER